MYSAGLHVVSKNHYQIKPGQILLDCSQIGQKELAAHNRIQGAIGHQTMIGHQPAAREMHLKARSEP